MTDFNRPNAPEEIYPKDTIDLIADSALQAGITLIGGLVGSGKSITTNAVIQRIKKNNNFDSKHVFYINTIEERESGRDIKMTVNTLIDKHEDSHLLVILDPILSEKTIDAVVELVGRGHSVIGTTECLIPISVAHVLKGAIAVVNDERKAALTTKLIENLNMITLQNSMTTCTTCNLTYRDKQNFVALLNTHGIDHVCDELNAMGIIRHS